MTAGLAIQYSSGTDTGLGRAANAVCNVRAFFPLFEGIHEAADTRSFVAVGTGVCTWLKGVSAFYDMYFLAGTGERIAKNTGASHVFSLHSIRLSGGSLSPINFR
jgi:hypothetical protein